MRLASIEKVKKVGGKRQRRGKRQLFDGRDKSGGWQLWLGGAGGAVALWRNVSVGVGAAACRSSLVDRL